MDRPQKKNLTCLFPSLSPSRAVQFDLLSPIPEGRCRKATVGLSSAPRFYLLSFLFVSQHAKGGHGFVPLQLNPPPPRSLHFVSNQSLSAANGLPIILLSPFARLPVHLCSLARSRTPPLVLQTSARFFFPCCLFSFSISFFPR
eukprot:RCo048018